MLLAGRKLTAQEAFDRGLVTDIIPQGEFRDFIAEKTKYLAGLPPKVSWFIFDSFFRFSVSLMAIIKDSQS